MKGVYDLLCFLLFPYLMGIFLIQCVPNLFFIALFRVIKVIH